MNPWQTHSIEQRYDNPWITVSHRKVTAPTGNPGIYGLVHFKNTAVGVVPIDRDGNTWLVGQHRYTLDQYMWEIPEGVIANQWTQLLELHTSNSVTDEYAVGFVAQDLSYGDCAPDDTEALQIRKVPLQTAIEMAMDGRITDGLAMACLFKVQLLLDRGTLVI